MASLPEMYSMILKGYRGKIYVSGEDITGRPELSSDIVRLLGSIPEEGMPIGQSPNPQQTADFIHTLEGALLVLVQRRNSIIYRTEAADKADYAASDAEVKAYAVHPKPKGHLFAPWEVEQLHRDVQAIKSQMPARPQQVGTH